METAKLHTPSWNIRQDYSVNKAVAVNKVFLNIYISKDITSYVYLHISKIVKSLQFSSVQFSVSLVLKRLFLKAITFQQHITIKNMKIILRSSLI